MPEVPDAGTLPREGKDSVSLGGHTAMSLSRICVPILV